MVGELQQPQEFCTVSKVPGVDGLWDLCSDSKQSGATTAQQEPVQHCPTVHA